MEELEDPVSKEPAPAQGADLNISLEDLCSIANKFAEQGRYEDAVELYERSIKLFPNSLALKINLGKVRNLLKEKEESEKHRMMGKFSEERARRDRLSVQVASIGKVFEKKGQEDKAVECYHLSLHHNPSNEQAHLNLAHVFYRANDFASALKELRAAITINPFNADAHALMGRALFYLKNYKAALHSIVDAMILENAAGRRSGQELQEKFKYLLEKQGMTSKAARAELVKARLGLFNQCVNQLDMQKEIALGKGAVQGLHEMARAGAIDAGRQDLLRLALRLRAFELMADLSDENLFVIAKFIKEEKYVQGQKIFAEADESDALYLIEKGEVHLSKETPFGEQILAITRRGEFFGEMNFIDPAQRSADAVAHTDCALFILRMGELKGFFDTHKEVAVHFYWHFWRSLSHRTREANNMLRTFFGDVESGPKQPLSQQEASISKAISIDLDHKLKVLQERGLSARELRLLAAFSGEELYNRDETIFREGAKGDKLYIILDGKVRISKHIPGVGEEALAILEKGDFFGEMALVDNEPRSADAKAHVNGTTVLTISRSVLNEILSVDVESAYQFLSILCRILTQRLREINLKIIQWRLMAGGF
jgi:CRP/FNR family transcriptional regulator, cyclic AMP receptor protein